MRRRGAYTRPVLDEPDRVAPSRRSRVLVVDDHTETTELLRILLSRRGFDVTTAHTGSEALRLASDAMPDLIYLDLGLPGMPGLEVLERLRTEPTTAEVPVVILTSSDSPRDKDQAAQLGATRYFRKPSRLAEFMKLGEIVRDILGGEGSRAST